METDFDPRRSDRASSCSHSKGQAKSLFTGRLVDHNYVNNNVIRRRSRRYCRHECRRGEFAESESFYQPVPRRSFSFHGATLDHNRRAGLQQSGLCWLFQHGVAHLVVCRDPKLMNISISYQRWQVTVGPKISD